MPDRAAAAPSTSVGPDTVWIDRLTHVELRARLDAGTRTALIPVGATEQNGPHMVLGKHNVRVALLAERIARQLGDAVVAPVLAYVPEGSVRPPAGHMRFTGTLSIPEPAFEGVLEGAARSLRQHGFAHVVLLGDHGGYQRNLERVAARLGREWGDATAVLAVTAFYAAQQRFEETLLARGYTREEMGLHAGLGDTALAMAADPTLVRVDRLAPPGGATASRQDGVRGDPTRASADLGQPGLQIIVDASVAAIRSRTAVTAKRAAPPAR